jgi:hypothetical protein
VRGSWRGIGGGFAKPVFFNGGGLATGRTSDSICAAPQRRQNCAVAGKTAEHFGHRRVLDITPTSITWALRCSFKSQSDFADRGIRSIIPW